MAYKKYIKRNGKLYGPYIYNSRRVNGKVTSEYHGATKRGDYKKFIFIFLGVLFVLGMGYGVVSNKIKFTGKIVDLDAQVIEGITNLMVTQLHESNDSVHKYDLNLEGVYSDDLLLTYDWEIDCGYFYTNDEDVGEGYVGSENVIEWYTTGECADAIVNVKVTSEDTEQMLVQSVFDAEDRLITNASLISSLENETEVTIEEIDIIENEEVEIDVVVTDSEIVSEEIEIVEDTLPLSDDEKQILINEFGNESVTSEVKLFNDRVIVRYEFGGMWIENSYDADLVKEDLEELMEEDRIRWLRNIINGISNDSSEEQELDGFEESYSI